MRNMSSSTCRVVGATAVTLLALVVAACSPSLPPPVISSPPVTGTSVVGARGGNVATMVACLPAGGAVTAELARLDTGPFNDSWLVQVRELGTQREEEASFPWQEIAILHGPDQTTIVSDPLPAGACVLVILQAPSYFDLPSPRFNYTVSW